MTNNSTKSRKGYLGKFTGLGLNVNAEEIYSSSYAAAAYLESIDFPKDKKVRRPLGWPLAPIHALPGSGHCASCILSMAGEVLAASHKSQGEQYSSPLVLAGQHASQPARRQLLRAHRRMLNFPKP